MSIRFISGSSSSLTFLNSFKSCSRCNIFPFIISIRECHFTICCYNFIFQHIFSLFYCFIFKNLIYRYCFFFSYIFFIHHSKHSIYYMLCNRVLNSILCKSIYNSLYNIFKLLKNRFTSTSILSVIHYFPKLWRYKDACYKFIYRKYSISHFYIFRSSTYSIRFSTC